MNTSLVQSTRLRLRGDERKQERLNAGRILALDGNLLGSQIKVDEGIVWVTQEGDLKDYVLSDSERLVIDRPGRVLIQAVQTARIALLPRAS